jgi:hypothetical protein
MRKLTQKQFVTLEKVAYWTAEAHMCAQEGDTAETIRSARESGIAYEQAVTLDTPIIALKVAIEFGKKPENFWNHNILVYFQKAGFEVR